MILILQHRTLLILLHLISKQDPSNKAGDPFVDVATDSEDEVFENYDDITNYVNSKSSKAKSGTSRDFKVQTRKKK